MAGGHKNGTVPLARARGWFPWVAFNVLLVASFLATLAISHGAVGESNQKAMEGMWSNSFPPLTHPLEMVGWFVSTHAGSMSAYPFGGPGGGSMLTFLCCLVGFGLLVRRRQWLLLAVLCVPLGLNFLAAAMHRFPYGEHMKFTLFSAVTFCALTGLGILTLLAWLARPQSRRAVAIVFGLLIVAAGALNLRDYREHMEFTLFSKMALCALLGLSALALLAWLTRRRPQAAVAVVLGLLVLVAGGSILRDLTHPYKSSVTLRSRDFAQWFWFDLAHDSELVCLETDWQANLAPGTFRWGWSSLYLCNQKIYSPRHARGEPPRLERVSAQRPLRCVLFRDTQQDPSTAALDRWLAEMQHSYTLIGRDRYAVPIYGKWDAPQDSIQDYIEVFKFVPAGEGKVAHRAAPTGPAGGPVR